VQARDVGTFTTASGAWVPYMVLEWLEGATLEAITLARQGQIEPARKRLDTATSVVRAAAKKLGDKDLEQLVQEMEDLSKDLAKIVLCSARIWSSQLQIENHL